MSANTVPFDEPSPWYQYHAERDYDLTISAGEGNWLPTIELVPAHSEVRYVFVQSFDDAGTFTPGYAIDNGVWSLPDEVVVPKWMPEAIEHAGFRYDATPNSERGGTGLVNDDIGSAVLTEWSDQ